MDEFFAALIGAIIGGIVTTFGNFKLDNHQRNRRRENLRAAIAVEVASLVEIVRRQEYAAELRAQASEIRASPPRNYGRMHIPASQNYFTIYETNAAELGNLAVGETAQIIAFYQQARSLLDTLAHDSGSAPELIDNEDAALWYEDVADHIEALCTFGDSLVSKLATGQVTNILSAQAKLLSPNTKVAH